MKLTGGDRNHFQLFCLQNIVPPESHVRVVGAFVDFLDVKKLGFKIKGEIKNGRPAYTASDLLKLYFYGHSGRVRSSRRLGREAETNVEVVWLLDGLRPCHKTMAGFRKENPGAFKPVFRPFNVFLRGEGLFSEDTVATDGSKSRAQNSKKNNYSERAAISEKLDHLSKSKEKYGGLKRDILEAHEKGTTQISPTGPDARALPKKMNIVEMGHNAVTTCGARNPLTTNFETLDTHDTYPLGNAAPNAREALGKKEGETTNIPADKGLDTGAELKACADNNVLTCVSPKSRVSPKKGTKFNKGAFFHDHRRDAYICPEKKELRSNGKWYNKDIGKLRRAYKVKHYKLPSAVCSTCPCRLECAGKTNLGNSKGKYIGRVEYQGYFDENTERAKLNKELYRKRQEIVEHPFGTAGRQWGYGYALMKGLEKVDGEFSIIFTTYNLRRSISIFGAKTLINKLRAAKILFSGNVRGILKGYEVIFLKK